MCKVAFKERLSCLRSCFGPYQPRRFLVPGCFEAGYEAGLGKASLFLDEDVPATHMAIAERGSSRLRALRYLGESSMTGSDGQQHVR